MPSTSNHFINPLELSTLDGIIGTTFNGITTYDSSGYSVASAGDVNGDGFDDVLIGAYAADPGGIPYAGSTYLIFGHTGIWSSSFGLETLNGTNGVLINGIAEGDCSGWSVASAGDVNGDGFDDVLIGAYWASPSNFSKAGSSYLIFGHAGIWSSPLSLDSLNGTNGIIMNGIAAGDWSGYSVASAGDVNGDGFADVLIGAPGNLTFGVGAGSTYLIFGHASTWSSPLALGSLNGTNGIIMNGFVGDWSGSSVSSAGDVNGDGLDDLLIGASYASPGGAASAGVTYLIFGQTTTWSSPLALSGLDGSNGVVIQGDAIGGQSGVSVASVFDVNGDGLDDVLIGARGYNLTGSSYLIFGQRGAWGSPLTLGSLNGINGLVIYGVASFDNTGCSVASAGDMNGDGLGDILIGAYGARGHSGVSYLIFGHSGSWNSTLTLGSINGINGLVINGIAANDDSGWSVAGALDANGDGLDDLLIGAYWASPAGRSVVGSTYLIFGDKVDLLTHTLTIDQGETVFLDNSMLRAYHSNNLAINASIPYNITNITHGVFTKLNFFQSELSQNTISFTHDGSIYPPSFDITIGNWAVAGPVAAIISFDAMPFLNLSSLSIGQGQTLVLTTQIIHASSLYYPSDALFFNVSHVLYGNFVQTNTTTPINEFNQTALVQGQIAFATDGSSSAPSYDISVSDGRISTSAVHGTVIFNTAPLLLNNKITLSSLAQKVLLSDEELSASDTTTPAGELIFKPSTHNCHFENINFPNTALASFFQGDVQSAQVLFVWDGYTTPRYNMSVSDGSLITERPASITLLSASNITRVVNPEPINRDAIIGGVVAASAMVLLFFGLQWYSKKRTKEQFQKILLEGTSGAEKAHNTEVLRPIANKIFEVINTTGCFGQRTEADTKAYMIAIGKIVSELRRQNANLNFNTMESSDKEAFINEIANQTRQQSLSKHKGGSLGNCTRYFKAEVTPEEIEYAAEGIARAAIAWQSRHMDSFDRTPSTSSIALGKISIDDSTLPEKSFTWMRQNHMQTTDEKDIKWLEERVAILEAELALSREQGAKP